MNTEPKNDAWQDVRKPLSSRAKRHLLFLATYSLGSIVVFFIVPLLPLQVELYSVTGAPIFSRFLTLFIGSFIFLPMGIMSFLDYGSDMPITERPPLVTLLVELQPLLVLLSYILISLIPLFGSSTEKPRTFRLLYLLFVALVIINVAGCLSRPVILP